MRNSAKNKVTVDVMVQARSWEKHDFDAVRLCRSIVPLTLAAAKLPPALKGKVLDVGVVLTTDAKIHALNAAYRNKNKPTDVLSFSNLDSANAGIEMQNDPFMLGDIILAAQTIARDARADKKTFKAHFTHLLVHGTLHLVGYDHMKPAEARVMEALEVKILKNLGLKNPYAAR